MYLTPDLIDMLYFLCAMFLFVLFVMLPIAVSLMKNQLENHFEAKKLPPAEITQYQMYVAIRKGMDECRSIHDMQDYYRAIIAYGNTYPDLEGRKDVTILIAEYNIKCARLVSPLQYHPN